MLVCFERPGLVRAKIGARGGRIAFGWNQSQVRSLARQISVSSAFPLPFSYDLRAGWPDASVPAADNKGPAAISTCRRWTRKFGGRWIRRRASSDLEFAGRRRSFHPRASRENNRPGGPQASRIGQSNNSWQIRSLEYQIRHPSDRPAQTALDGRDHGRHRSVNRGCASLSNARASGGISRNEKRPGM